MYGTGGVTVGGVASFEEISSNLPPTPYSRLYHETQRNNSCSVFARKLVGIKIGRRRSNSALFLEM